MQERYFPLCQMFIDGKLEATNPFGLGQLTPELAHQEGLGISSDPFTMPFHGPNICQRKYTNRVQALWVPGQ